MHFGRFKIALAISGLLLVFLALVETEERKFTGKTAFNSTALAQGHGKVISVKDFGAKGDGVSDDTAAIQRAVNAATNGTTIRFPTGTYIVSNFVAKNKSGLSFVGEGRSSLIKQNPRAERIATFYTSRDIVITKLAFDANGKPSYGGIMFYAVTGVRIENNSFVDSAAKPIGREDRYSLVFGRGSEPSRDIKIINNVIEDLQLEVNHSQRVVIDRNIVKRAVRTAGIGIFTVGDNAIAEDYQITNNTVEDPIAAGFSVGIDPPTNNRCIFRRITLADNQVIRTKTVGFGVRIGTPDFSQKTTGNVFEDLVIKNNRLRVEAAAPQPVQMILASTSPAAGIVFERLIVTGNTIENDGFKNKGYAIDLRRIQNSIVVENTIKGVTKGISVGVDLLANEVRNNAVDASDVAYALQGSLGRNRVANNRIVGNPREGWRLSNLNTTDSVEQ